MTFFLTDLSHVLTNCQFTQNNLARSLLRTFPPRSPSPVRELFAVMNEWLHRFNPLSAKPTK